MKLDIFLSELLFEHDCVVIPLFGGIVTNYRHARLNDLNHTIYPPSKQLAFNRNLVQNDGLLYKHVSEMLSINYAEARILIDQQVSQMKVKIQAGERIVLERIGIFFPDKRGVIQFIPSDQENYLLQSYGLPSIQLQPVLQMTEPLTEGTEAPENTPLVVVHRSNHLRWKIAATIAIPLLLAGGWLAGERIFGHDQAGRASLKLLSWDQPAAHYTPRTETLVWPDSNEKEVDPLDSIFSQTDASSVKFSFSDEVLDSSGIVVTKPREQVAEAIVTPVIQEGSFHLIAGAFQVEQNAENLISQLSQKGLKPYRAGMKGNLHLVSLGSYTNHHDATDAKVSVRNQSDLKCWVFEKR